MRTALFKLYVQATVVLEVLQLGCVCLSIKESNMFLFYASVFKFLSSGAFFFVVFCYCAAIPKKKKHPGDKSCRIIFV